MASREAVENAQQELGRRRNDARQKQELKKKEKLESEALQQTWGRLLQDTASPLYEMLRQETLASSGQSPGVAAVQNFLKGVGRADSFPSPTPEKSAPSSTDAGIKPGKPAGAGKKPPTHPTAFWLDKRRYPVKSWREILVKTCEVVISKVGEARFKQAVAPTRGKRHFISSSKQDLRAPGQIEGTRLWVETNFGSEGIERRSEEILLKTVGTAAGFRIEESRADTPGNVRAGAASAPGAALAAAPTAGADATTKPGQPADSGKKPSIPPAAFWLDGRRYLVKRWREILVKTCEAVISKVGEARFKQAVASIKGQKKPYFSPSGEGMHAPSLLAGSNLYVETGFSSQRIEKVARRILQSTVGSDAGFRIEAQK